MGAPKGNTNALKHGLYARHFKPRETDALRRLSPRDFRREIDLMRVVVGRLSGIHAQLNEQVRGSLLAGQPCDVDALAKISNSLSLAVTALNTTARTHAILSGADAVVIDAFEVALNSLPIFIDDKHLIECQADKEDQQEILIDEPHL
jgi:hypothetical protein